jgi:hypothetical protein
MSFKAKLKFFLLNMIEVLFDKKFVLIYVVLCRQESGNESCCIAWMVLQKININKILLKKLD